MGIASWKHVDDNVLIFVNKTISVSHLKIKKKKCKTEISLSLVKKAMM